jgi:hypothetical protein
MLKKRNEGASTLRRRQPVVFELRTRLPRRVTAIPAENDKDEKNSICPAASGLFFGGKAPCRKAPLLN